MAFFNDPGGHTLALMQEAQGIHAADMMLGSFSLET
jgi:hypothetical protein